MLGEGDLGKREFIKQNIYSLFEKLLGQSDKVPTEFTRGTKKLTALEQGNLYAAGFDAIEDQLKQYIEQLRDDFDPEEYYQKILAIINQNKERIDEDLYEDLIIFLKYGKKRRKDEEGK